MTGPAVRVIVAVDPDRYADVVSALRRAGLEVDREWPRTGTLAGRAEPACVPVLRGIDGVLGVGAPRTFRITPQG
ncbi:MAG TPA: hypothetical protein VGD72_02445 [Mycobacteriales bacterium]|jgi:hypothetical protein